MKGFQTISLYSAGGKVYIFASVTCNTGHFGNEIDMADLETPKGLATHRIHFERGGIHASCMVLLLLLLLSLPLL